jgi:hypothetical protein
MSEEGGWKLKNVLIAGDRAQMAFRGKLSARFFKGTP